MTAWMFWLMICALVWVACRVEMHFRPTEEPPKPKPKRIINREPWDAKVGDPPSWSFNGSEDVIVNRETREKIGDPPRFDNPFNVDRTTER